MRLSYSLGLFLCLVYSNVAVLAAPLFYGKAHALARRAATIEHLFPLGRGVESWTVSPKLDGALPLSDDTLRPTRVTGGTPGHHYVKAPDGVNAMQAIYPKGSSTFGHEPRGGFSLYGLGPEKVSLQKAKEATIGYSVYFPDGFDFVLGGKLPGPYGGDSADEAVKCSGGSRSDKCFSARMMWREGGDGELYSYLPPSAPANQAICGEGTHCNEKYGASTGRGSFKFEPGTWTTVSERIKLNDFKGGEPVANGEIEVFVNGESVIQLEKLVLRTSESGKMHGIQIQTFFGGSSPGFETPIRQEAFFADFSVAILETL